MAASVFFMAVVCRSECFIEAHEVPKKREPKIVAKIQKPVILRRMIPPLKNI